MCALKSFRNGTPASRGRDGHTSSRIHYSCSRIFYTSRRAGRYRLRCYRHCCFRIASMHVKSESVVRGLSRKYKDSERDAGHVGCTQLEQG